VLRVGLTGGLGSGKSTVAAMLTALGAHVLSADEIAREQMQPGQPVFDAIARQFGPQVLRSDGSLDRPALASIAFNEGRLDELNAIVHPATLKRQEELAAEIFSRQPNAILIVESALIFETTHGNGWRTRFDRMILVRATDQHKVERFVARTLAHTGSGNVARLEADARARLAKIIPDDRKAPLCDFVIQNDGTLDDLRQQVQHVWTRLDQPL
jgi:dephospho-CoA kinase